MYLYEPLHYAQLVGHPVHKESHLSPDRQTRDFVHQELLRLLTCQFEEQMFNESLKLMIWKKPKVAPIVTESQRRSWCLELDLRVAKVIRPGLGALLPLLELPDYDIHIVHLVDDDDARGQSVHTQAHQKLQGPVTFQAAESHSTALLQRETVDDLTTEPRRRTSSR
ncbi:uncharacterized protein LOC122367408 [Amphibalanus amphitrite]|uniref:uncharacterized protein LOC122367408 n=1 Tax=Amphibalanus amphitrite TaxID=1232801 RepID=UPI001C918E16|nr:uncharacterized protein LOC122367408 [Amphibalanus amphitrite]